MSKEVQKEFREMVEQIKELAEQVNADSYEISGEMADKWGFSFKVYSPIRWKEREKRRDL